MMKHCAINLNERYRLSFKYSRDNTYVFSKKKIIDFIQHMYLHWHYLFKNSSRWCATLWKKKKMKNGVYRNWLVAKDLWKEVITQSSNLLNKHQWSSYLQIIWDYVLFQSPIYKHRRNGAKKKWALFKHIKRNKNIKNKNKLIIIIRRRIERNFKHI